MQEYPPRPADPAAAARSELSVAAAVGGLVITIVGFVLFLPTPVSSHLHNRSDCSQSTTCVFRFSASEPYKRKGRHEKTWYECRLLKVLVLNVFRVITGEEAGRRRGGS